MFTNQVTEKFEWWDLRASFSDNIKKIVTQQNKNCSTGDKGSIISDETTLCDVLKSLYNGEIKLSPFLRSCEFEGPGCSEHSIPEPTRQGYSSDGVITINAFVSNVLPMTATKLSNTDCIGYIALKSI